MYLIVNGDGIPIIKILKGESVVINIHSNEGQATYILIKEKTMTDTITGTIYMIVIIAFIYHVFSGNVNR